MREAASGGVKRLEDDWRVICRDLFYAGTLITTLMTQAYVLYVMTCHGSYTCMLCAFLVSIETVKSFSPLTLKKQNKSVRMSETGNTLQAVNMLCPNCSENQPILSSIRQKKPNMSVKSLQLRRTWSLMRNSNEHPPVPERPSADSVWTAVCWAENLTPHWTQLETRSCSCVQFQSGQLFWDQAEGQKFNNSHRNRTSHRGHRWRHA